VAHVPAGAGIHLPAAARQLDSAVLVPRPGLTDERESMACISVTALQELTAVAGDEVGGSGRVAIVQDAGDGAGFVAFGAPKRGIEIVEAAVALDEQRMEGPVIGRDGR